MPFSRLSIPSETKASRKSRAERSCKLRFVVTSSALRGPFDRWVKTPSSMALNNVLDAIKAMPSCIMFAGVMTGFDDIGLSLLRLIWKAQNLLRRGTRGQTQIQLGGVVVNQITWGRQIQNPEASGCDRGILADRTLNSRRLELLL